MAAAMYARKRNAKHVCVCVGQRGGLPSDRSCCREAYTCTRWELKSVSPWKPGAREIGGHAVETAHRTGV